MGFKLNVYDYGARNYDPALGRWMNTDPLAEHSPDKTPYHYCSNNPINRIDPTGMCDDPNCTHGAIRRGWDAIGRFFGNAWGHSENATAKQDNVTAGPIQEIDSQSPEEQAKYQQDIQNLNSNFGGTILGMLHFIQLTAGGAASETATVAREGIIGESAVVTGVTTEVEATASSLANETNVMRGGTCLGCQFENGSGVTMTNGVLDGVSVNSANGVSLESLAGTIKNGRVGTTTVGEVRALGGEVTPSPTPYNPFHSTLSGITPQQAENLFAPTIKNPIK